MSISDSRASSSSARKCTTATAVAARVVEQVARIRRTCCPAGRLQNEAHVLAHRQLFAGDVVMRVQPGALQHLEPRFVQIDDVDVGEALLDRLLDDDDGAARSRGPPAATLRCAAAASFICSYSRRRRTSSARGSSTSSPVSALRTGSSMRDLISMSSAAISRYSAASSRLLGADLVDVRQVLDRQRRHRDVEDVEVLLADQVEQQVQRSLERLEEHLERVGRDVEIARAA